MGDKINFPHNNEIYFRKIVNYIQENKLEKALNLAKIAYEKENNFDNNYLYVHIFNELTRYEEAFKVAQKYEKQYLNNNITKYSYVRLLIKTHRFIKAEYIITNAMTDKCRQEMDWAILKEELTVEKKKVKKETEQERESLKNKLLQLSDYPLIIQQQIIKESETLDLLSLQNIAPYIFSNLNIIPQIQRSFLENLIIKNDRNKYIFDWFGKQRQICPVNLKTFDETLNHQKLVEKLRKKLEKNPSLFEIVQNEIINDLLLLYPFIEETITDMNFWIDEYVIHFENVEKSKDKPKKLTEEQKNMKIWIEKFHLLSHRV